jgi:hypothetical protein
MTNCTSQSDRSQESGVRSQNHESVVWFDGPEGVRYAIRCLSVARRILLARRIREIGRGVEFFEASADPREKLEAAVLAAEIDRAYLEWGLEAVEGLTIDGEAATPATLIETGPMDLATEILARIKAECGLSEGERKN